MRYSVPLLPLPDTARVVSLTGLRFFAALAVFGIHAGAVFDVSIGDYSPVMQGTVGVSFFFLLSGFLLAWSYRPNDSYRVFWQRRFARVYPAYCVAWLVVMAGNIIQGDGFGWLDALTLTLTQAWFPDDAVYFATSAVFWSLSAEAFFYLVFPFVIGGLHRMTELQRIAAMVAIVLGVVVIGFTVVATGDDAVGTWFAYIFPPVRALEFILGILLCLQYRARPRWFLPLPAAVLLTVVAYLAAGFAPGALRPVSVTLVPFALLVVSAVNADVLGRASIFRHPILVRLGEWSYALYLVHLTVLAVYPAALNSLLGLDPLELGTAATVVHVFAALGLSILGSALLFSWVEKPLNARLRPRPRREPDDDVVVLGSGS